MVKLLSNDEREQCESSGILKRISDGDIKVFRGQVGLKLLSREIVACLDYREGCGAKPDLFDWLFSHALLGAGRQASPNPERGAAT